MWKKDKDKCKCENTCVCMCHVFQSISKLSFRCYWYSTFSLSIMSLSTVSLALDKLKPRMENSRNKLNNIYYDVLLYILFYYKSALYFHLHLET